LKYIEENKAKQFNVITARKHSMRRINRICGGAFVKVTRITKYFFNISCYEL
jgi:hypothetical protein